MNKISYNLKRITLLPSGVRGRNSTRIRRPYLRGQVSSRATSDVRGPSLLRPRSNLESWFGLDPEIYPSAASAARARASWCTGVDRLRGSPALYTKGAESARRHPISDQPSHRISTPTRGPRKEFSINMSFPGQYRSPRSPDSPRSPLSPGRGPDTGSIGSMLSDGGGTIPSPFTPRGQAEITLMDVAYIYPSFYGQPRVSGEAEIRWSPL